MAACRFPRPLGGALRCREKADLSAAMNPSFPAQNALAASSAVAASPKILEHKIPSAGSAPYICVEGPDRCLWFCESGASKIGRFDPASAAFTEFTLPTPNANPIGCTIGPDGNVW